MQPEYYGVWLPETDRFKKDVSLCISLIILNRLIHKAKLINHLTNIKGKGKGEGHPCTGTESLYRPYGPQGE